MEEVCKLCGQSKYEGYRSVDDLSLKKYVDTRFAAMQNVVDLRSSLIQVALDKSEGELSKRFDGAKDYVDVRFTANQLAVDKADIELIRKLGEEREYVNTHFTCIQVAIDKAEMGINKRLEGMNEFREQLKDQAAQLVTRTEFGAIQKLVYIGLGAVLAFELLLKFLIK